MTSSQFFSFTWNLLFYASLPLKSSMVTVVTNTDMLWLNFIHREKKVFLLSAHLLFRIFTTSFQKKKIYLKAFTEIMVVKKSWLAMVANF